MKVKTAVTLQSNIQKACKELANQLGVSGPGVILYFASTEYSPQTLAAEMEKTFPGSKLFGCTTAGEIVTGKMLKKSVVAMALPSDIIEDVCIQVVENIKVVDHLGEAFKNFEEYYHIPTAEFDLSKYVGIVLYLQMAKLTRTLPSWHLSRPETVSIPLKLKVFQQRPSNLSLQMLMSPPAE